MMFLYIQVLMCFQSVTIAAEAEASTVQSVSMEANTDFKRQILHNAVLFAFLLCSGASISLGLLTAWHAWLITSGETSIEAHINKKESKRLKKKKMVMLGFWFIKLKQVVFQIFSLVNLMAENWLSLHL